MQGLITGTLFDNTLFHTIITIMTYIILLYFSMRGGANWITILASFIIFSTIFLFLGIDSPLNIFNIIKDLVAKIWELITVIFEVLIQKMVNRIVTGITNAWKWVLDRITDIWNILVLVWDKVKDLFNNIVAEITKLWNNIVGWFKNIWEKIKFWE